MGSIDKPNGVALGWERLDTSYPFDYHMFRVRKDMVRWPDGHLAPYAYVEAVGAVWVVPLTADGDVILIRQFRYTMDAWCWEVPAGGFHDFEGTPVALAQQELAEEVGGSSDDWRYISAFNTGASILEEKCHIVLARNVQLDREPLREPAEIIKVHPTPIARALDMARSSEIADVHSALALLCCEPYLVQK